MKTFRVFRYFCVFCVLKDQLDDVGSGVLAVDLHVPFAHPEVELAIFGFRRAGLDRRLRTGLRSGRASTRTTHPRFAKFRRGEAMS